MADEYTTALYECVISHGGVWPAELTSGVMFWRGQRITYAEFQRAANGGNPHD